MPCPEKFKESLRAFSIAEDTVRRVNEGYEDLVSSSPKKRKAAYFQRATEILMAEADADTVHRLYESNACCRGGQREKASKAFAARYAGLDFRERLPHLGEVPYMGTAELESENVLLVHAVSLPVGGQYACACSNFSKSGFHEPVRKDYCHCCAGHFLHHYQIMLGVRLSTIEIVFSPLDSGGAQPCVMRFAVHT